MNDADLISLAWCKDLLSTDERDDALLAAVIGSCSARIERYLMRKVLERSIVCCFDSLGAQELLLAEYPVRCDPARAFGEESELAEASWYCATVPYEVFEDLPAALIFDWFLSLTAGSGIIRVEYTAGYPLEHMPEDLALASLAASVLAAIVRGVKGG